MKTLKTLLITALLLGAPSAMALAQVSPNQHEMMRQYGLDCSQRYDGCANNNTPPQQVVWENRYGAIAADWEASKGGFAEDQPSARAARRVALRQCGTRNCKIVAHTRNGCLAVAYGGGGNGLGQGPTSEAATLDAMNNCEQDGSTCEPTYLHCSLPVRIR